MTKPIFVIYIKVDCPAHLYEERFRVVKKELELDYHVLFLQSTETKCELFSGEKIDAIEIEELKQKIDAI